MAVSFGDLSSAAGLEELNSFLLTRSYISGYSASRDDLAVYSALASAPSAAEYVNAARWYKHITALLGSNFPGDGVGVVIGSTAAAPSSAPASAPAVAAAEPVKAPEPSAAAPPEKAEAVEEDDDDLDLFGEETEDEKKAKEERAAAAAKSGKKKESGKSSVLLDIKPWDDETDMKKLEEMVRNVQMEGLHWGASKLVPVGYGIKKLQVMMTIVDDLVGVDELIEDKLTQGECAEYVQSCDVVAFNKI
eukprot:TRINITY_DN5154_c0_g3_i1.p1 TRINITY_DN5154_c0_g3~~TRINITY_DN5154_c0_g3_i1.p1  ORF type:complete len:264 (+),score=105.13 TRINITY_DN5154_c0_g3_i1:50-793(+)